MLRAFLASLAGVVALSSTAARAQAPSDARGAAAELRRLYFLHDYAGAVSSGHTLVLRFPRSPEVAAWYIGSVAKNGMGDEALASADSLLRAHPGSPWGELARALAMPGEEAVRAARRARLAAPTNPDAWWVSARTLAFLDAGSAVAVADSAIARFGPSARLLDVKGIAHQIRARMPGGDSVDFARARAALDEAIRLDSADVEAVTDRADLDPADRNHLYAAYRRAASLSPNAIDVHEGYWSAIQGLQDRTDQQKGDEIVADAERMLRERPDDPGTILSVASAYRGLKQHTRADSLEADLLTRFATSPTAELLLLGRVNRINNDLNRGVVEDTAKARAQYRRMLREFVARPVHRSSARLASAYTSLLIDISRDTAVAASELARVVEGAAKDPLNPHIGCILGPIALADRRVALPLAERLAREAPGRFAASLQSRRAYLTPERMEQQARASAAMAKDALAWVYFAEGKNVLARRLLVEALVADGNSTSALYHMGRLEEAAGHFDEAGRYYARGFAVEQQGMRGQRNRDALKHLYASKHGGMDGYESFIAQIRDKDRAERRAKTLSERANTPRIAPAFALERLDGGTVSSNELKGKIAVVNFWGTWCGPCLLELPQIEKLYQKYRGDSGVAFFTVDFNDSDVGKVREFLARRKFDFPVLIDNGYVVRAGIRSYPTTWIMDQTGKIVFTVSGGTSSDTLFEEYVWRIESLRAPAGAAKAAANP